METTCAVLMPHWLADATSALPMQPPAAPGQAQPATNGVCMHACCAARPYCIIERLNDVKKVQLVGFVWIRGVCCYSKAL